VDRREIEQTILCVLLAVLAVGCGKLIGADGYAVEDVSNPCGALEVLADGRCTRVGVSRCADGFLDDHRGGCTAVMPQGLCQEKSFIARPGLEICAPISTGVCTSFRFWPDVEPLDASAYVLAGERDGDGTKERPFGSIEEALASTSNSLSLVLGPGDYATPLHIKGRRVDVYGLCPTETRLQSRNGEPSIRIEGPAANGSRIQTLSLSGAGPGVEVIGATGVILSRLWLHDLEGPGFSIFDGDAGADLGETSVLAENCVIERATGAGISVHGAKLELVTSSVVQTQTQADRGGHRGLGLWVGPERSFEGNEPSARRRAEVSLVKSAILESRGAAILAEGALVSVRSSVIRGVLPDALGAGRGIEIRATSPGRVETELSVSGSVIEDAHDVGVSSWNAKLVIEDSVVRDVGGGMAGRCLGNGIRARYDLLRDADVPGPRLVARNSLIERTRQAAVHVEGGSARIESSIVRETSSEACGPGHGDGIAAYPSPTGPALLEVTKTRIEASSRSGIAVFSAPGELEPSAQIESSVLECSGPGIGGRGATPAVRDALCGCSGRWSRCAGAIAELEPALLGRSRCNSADDTACFRGCVGNIAQQDLMPGAVVWPFGRDEITSVMTGEDGCFELEGLPRETPLVVAFSHETHLGSIGMVSPLAEDSPASYRAELVPTHLISLARQLAGSRDDGRRGISVLVRVCSFPKSFARPDDTICVGLPGIRAYLSPGSASARLYFGPSNVPEDPMRTETLGADILFVDVEPGTQFIELEPPSFKTLNCELDTGGLGWPTETPNRFRVFVEPGWGVLGVVVNCTLTPAGAAAGR
jgi:hypothetical protein